MGLGVVTGLLAVPYSSCPSVTQIQRLGEKRMQGALLFCSKVITMTPVSFLRLHLRPWWTVGLICSQGCQSEVTVEAAQIPAFTWKGDVLWPGIWGRRHSRLRYLSGL